MFSKEWESITLKPKKCELFQLEAEYLGKLVNAEGISISSDKKQAVLKWPTPISTKELMSFLGFVNYHRDHVPDFATMTCCLYELAQSKECIWLSRHETALQQIKKHWHIHHVWFILHKTENLAWIQTPRTIALGQFYLKFKVIRKKSYASHALLKPHRKYCTTRKEFLAVAKFCRHFRHYLLGRRFTLRTDQNSLVWLMCFKHIEGQLARWLEELGQFDMK